MPRCKKQRCCRILENERVFKPIGIPMVELESVEIEIDELEAIRLCDYEGKSQIETAELMQISRGTVQRILNSGRKKILDALLHQKAIKLKNTGDEKWWQWNFKSGISNKWWGNSRGAFWTLWKICSIFSKRGRNSKEEVLDAPEHAPGVFPKFIAENNINVVITGGMGQRAIDLIKANGGQVILGAIGEIKEVLEVYLQGSLYSKGSACAHHHHEEGHKCEH